MDWQIYGQYENQNRKTELSELKPETETGRQELLRDKLCEAYRRQGLDVAVLRIGLVYDPSQPSDPTQPSQPPTPTPSTDYSIAIRTWLQNFFRNLFSSFSSFSLFRR
jgi:nucleoside-diphosphate-sugar epimerase